MGFLIWFEVWGWFWVAFFPFFFVSLQFKFSNRSQGRMVWNPTPNWLQELSLPLFGVLGSNHFEDHKSHIVEASPPAFVDGLHFRSASLPPSPVALQAGWEGWSDLVRPLPCLPIPCQGCSRPANGEEGSSCGVWGFLAVCGSALCFMRKLLLIPQPIWQTFLLSPPFPPLFKLSSHLDATVICMWMRGKRVWMEKAASSALPIWFGFFI